jgi:mono/diheme cytochrome c family protein
MSRRKAKRVAAWISAVLTSTLVAISSIGAQNSQLTRESAKELKSPVPFAKSSIARGRTLFANYCTGCHGNDGKAMIDVIANATDLTEPKLWTSGTSEGETFRSIREGAGLNMPPFKNQIHKEEDLWHLVNFIRSLWPESLRPKLQEEKSQQPP